MVYKSQSSALGIDGKRADASGLFSFMAGGFIHRVQITLFGIDGQKGGMNDTLDFMQNFQLARIAIHPTDIDPLAFPGRVGSDVNEIVQFRCLAHCVYGQSAQKRSRSDRF